MAVQKTISGNFTIAQGTKQEVLDDLAASAGMVQILAISIDHVQDKCAVMYSV